MKKALVLCEFVLAMQIMEVNVAKPFLQGYDGRTWAMIEFWDRDEEIATTAALKLAEKFNVELKYGDFTRVELGL